MEVGYQFQPENCAGYLLLKSRNSKFNDCGDHLPPMTKAVHRHGSADARVKSFYLLVLISVASTLLVHMAVFQKHTQTNQLANDYPLIVNHRLQQTPLYLKLKPSEAIYLFQNHLSYQILLFS